MIRHPIISRLLVIAFGMFSYTSSHSAESMQTNAPDWAAQYKVGDQFPDFRMLDQSGTTQTPASITGEKGYLIVFNRSVVW